MNSNTEKVIALTRQLLSALGNCTALCDKIIVLSYANEDAPLPPQLGESASSTERFEAAQTWLSQASQFVAGQVPGGQYGRLIAKQQDTLHSVVTLIHKELADIAEQQNV